MSYPVYIALGSNQGDRLEALKSAVLALFPRSPVCRVSAVYETPPWGYLAQPAFLNMVAEVETSLSPLALLDLLQTVEKKMGRTKEILNGPRIIDLDILFIESQVYQDDQLIVPHPRIRGRGFVLRPMMDLAPRFIHPLFNLSISDLLDECDLTSIYSFITAERFESSLAPVRFLPDEAALAFKEYEHSGQIFNRLPPSHQQEYIRFISDAKKIETRQRRVQKMLAMLADKEQKL